MRVWIGVALLAALVACEKQAAYKSVFEECLASRAELQP